MFTDLNLDTGDIMMNFLDGRFRQPLRTPVFVDRHRACQASRLQDAQCYLQRTTISRFLTLFPVVLFIEIIPNFAFRQLHKPLVL